MTKQENVKEAPQSILADLVFADPWSLFKAISHMDPQSLFSQLKSIEKRHNVPIINQLMEIVSAKLILKHSESPWFREILDTTYSDILADSIDLSNTKIRESKPYQSYIKELDEHHAAGEIKCQQLYDAFLKSFYSGISDPIQTFSTPGRIFKIEILRIMRNPDSEGPWDSWSTLQIADSDNCHRQQINLTVLMRKVAGEWILIRDSDPEWIERFGTPFQLVRCSTGVKEKKDVERAIAQGFRTSIKPASHSYPGLWMCQRIYINKSGLKLNYGMKVILAAKPLNFPLLSSAAHLHLQPLVSKQLISPLVSILSQYYGV